MSSTRLPKFSTKKLGVKFMVPILIVMLTVPTASRLLLHTVKYRHKIVLHLLLLFLMLLMLVLWLLTRIGLIREHLLQMMLQVIL